MQEIINHIREIRNSYDLSPDDSGMNVDIEEYLSSIPKDNPIWFLVWASRPDMLEWEIKFVVNSDLHGEAEQDDPKIPGLFKRTIEEFHSGKLNIEHFGTALRHLARRSTYDRFMFIREVLEQTLRMPCSMIMWNRQAPDQYQLKLPAMTKIIEAAHTRIQFPLKPLLIENYEGDPRRLFIEPGPGIVRHAYNDQTDPIDPTWFEDIEWSNRKVLDSVDRLEFFYSNGQPELRDVVTTPPKRIVQRISLVHKIWENLEPQYMMVERNLVEPDMLADHIRVVREAGFPAFNIIMHDGDALTIAFSREPVVEVGEESLSIILKPLTGN